MNLGFLILDFNESRFKAKSNIGLGKILKSSTTLMKSRSWWSFHLNF